MYTILFRPYSKNDCVENIDYQRTNTVITGIIAVGGQSSVLSGGLRRKHVREYTRVEDVPPNVDALLHTHIILYHT